MMINEQPNDPPLDLGAKGYIFARAVAWQLAQWGFNRTGPNDEWLISICGAIVTGWPNRVDSRGSIMPPRTAVIGASRPLPWSPAKVS